MKISLVVAAAENGAIGKDNQLLWKLSSDLKRFKHITTGHHLLMGRKTFESIGKPLPNRRNIIISRQNLNIDGVEVINSIDEIKNIQEDIFIIGGGEIYKSCIIFADKIYATEIDCEIEADTWFPKIENYWKIESLQEFKADEKNQYDYKFINYVK